MLNTHSQPDYVGAMPKLAVWLLNRLANPAYRDELIGDMEEEYLDRRRESNNAANWLAKQVFFAIWDGQKAMVRTTGFIKIISVVFCLLALPTIMLFVGWLSNMEEPSEKLWHLLLTGEVHQLFFNIEYWQHAWRESGIRHLQLSMFINIPAIFWAGVFFVSSLLFFKNTTPSAMGFGLFMLAFIVLPYCFGYAVINVLEPAPKKVGPILAFMTLTPFWTLIVYIGLLFKQYKK